MRRGDDGEILAWRRQRRAWAFVCRAVYTRLGRLFLSFPSLPPRFLLSWAILMGFLVYLVPAEFLARCFLTVTVLVIFSVRDASGSGWLFVLSLIGRPSGDIFFPEKWTAVLSPMLAHIQPDFAIEHGSRSLDCSSISRRACIATNSLLGLPAAVATRASCMQSYYRDSSNSTNPCRSRPVKVTPTNV